MNKRHYEHTLPNIRGSLSNTYSFTDSSKDPRLIFKEVTSSHCRVNSLNISIMFLSVPF